MTPPWIVSGIGLPAPGATPLRQKKAAGGDVLITVANSGSAGILMFGGWMFPINPTSAFDRGTISVATRDSLGDVYHIQDSFRPVDPPDYTMQTIFTSKSEPWDTNDAIFGATRNCVNISNGARITKGAGVAATFTCHCEVLINTSLIGSDTCPGGGGPSAGPTVYQRDFNIIATFTG